MEKEQKAILEAIDIMIKQKLRNLGFNYYVDGVIQTKNQYNSYDVVINGVEYKNIPAKNGYDYSQGDTVQILIKNGNWDKKFIDDKITHNETPENLLTLGRRVRIPTGSNLNDYKQSGSYAVYGNIDAEKEGEVLIQNLPINQAGILDVYSSNGVGINNTDYIYIIQEYTVYTGETTYRRHITKNGTSGEWVYCDWVMVLNEFQIKDYVIEEGTKNVTDPNTNNTVAWTYRKWNSGVAECWIKRNVNVNVTSPWGTALYYGTVSTINFPFKFAEVPVVNVTCEYGTDNKSLFIASCGYSSQNYARSIMLCRTDTGTVNCNLLYQVQGRWK